MNRLAQTQTRRTRAWNDCIITAKLIFGDLLEIIGSRDKLRLQMQLHDEEHCATEDHCETLCFEIRDECIQLLASAQIRSWRE